MTKVPQTTWNRDMWGIANAQGKPWTSTVFHTKTAAEEYLARENGHPLDLSRHSVVPISVTIRVIRATRSDAP